MPNVQTRNSELPGNLMPEFWSRKDAIVGLVNAMNFPTAFTGVRSFWPMSIMTPAGLVVDHADVAGGGNLTFTAGAALGVTVGIVPCMTCNGAGHATPATPNNYLQATALTLGAWVYPTTNPGSAIGIIGRWKSAGGNEKSYLVYQNGMTFNFNCSSDGTAEFPSGAATFPSLNKWYRVVGRYTPSTSVSIFVNGRQVATNTTAIPATLYVTPGAQPFRIGSYSTPASYFTGNIGFPFFAVSNLADEAIFADFESSRAAFGV